MTRCVITSMTSAENAPRRVDTPTRALHLVIRVRHAGLDVPQLPTPGPTAIVGCPSYAVGCPRGSELQHSVQEGLLVGNVMRKRLLVFLKILPRGTDQALGIQKYAMLPSLQKRQCPAVASLRKQVSYNQSIICGHI